MSSSDSSCDLDVIPTSLLKSCLNSSNLSPLSSTCHFLRDLCQLPSSMLLSNLCSKNTTYLKMNSPVIVQSQNWFLFQRFLEHIIHARISSHLVSFPLITPFQSAYRQFHSTETTLLCIQNDLLAINKQKVSTLVLFILSFIFDIHNWS